MITGGLLKVADLASEDTPQLYVACGRGPRSTLRVLRHGLEVSTECLVNFMYRMCRLQKWQCQSYLGIPMQYGQLRET